jgi:iron complex transport system permease protein
VPRARAESPARAPLGVLALLVVATCAILLLHVGVGSHLWMRPWDILSQIFAGIVPGDRDNVIVWQIRLPRAVACVLVGGLLGAVGSAFQALFRNPLADPYIVGVSSGAAVGGSIALVTGLGALFGGLGIMLFAFVGGILAMLLVLALARRRGVIDVQSLLLAGVVTGSLLGAVLALILLSAGQDTTTVLRWLMGSTTPMPWSKPAILAPVLLLGGLFLVRQSRYLNAFAVNEETAQRLGVNTHRLKLSVLTVGTAMTAVTVGSVGIIGFLGLVAPHISRRLLGVDWRWSLVGAIFLGASLLLLADILAQRAVAYTELPVGIVTALVGAPFLLVLLKRKG